MGRIPDLHPASRRVRWVWLGRAWIPLAAVGFNWHSLAVDWFLGPDANIHPGVADQPCCVGVLNGLLRLF